MCFIVRSVEESNELRPGVINPHYLYKFEEDKETKLNYWQVYWRDWTQGEWKPHRRINEGGNLF
jgi:hypothetical protein